MARAVKVLDPEAIPSPPRWLINLAGAVGTMQHAGQGVRYNLPEGWTMTARDRRTAETFHSALSDVVSADCPFQGRDGREAKGALLLVMIRGLAGTAKESDLAAAAKAQMYDHAIEDLPAWAVDRAIKRWARAECPESVEERPNYAFPPSPATLRRLALWDLDVPRRHHAMIGRLLAALPFERAMDPTPVPGGAAVPALRKL